MAGAQGSVSGSNWRPRMFGNDWPVSPINLNQEIVRTGGLQNLEPVDWDKVHRNFPPEHDELNWLISLFNLGPTGLVCPGNSLGSKGGV
jgi:hypothetical protein